MLIGAAPLLYVRANLRAPPPRSNTAAGSGQRAAGCTAATATSEVPRDLSSGRQPRCGWHPLLPFTGGDRGTGQGSGLLVLQNCCCCASGSSSSSTPSDARARHATEVASCEHFSCAPRAAPRCHGFPRRARGTRRHGTCTGYGRVYSCVKAVPRYTPYGNSRTTPRRVMMMQYWLLTKIHHVYSSSTFHTVHRIVNISQSESTQSRPASELDSEHLFEFMTQVPDHEP